MLDSNHLLILKISAAICNKNNFSQKGVLKLLNNNNNCRTQERIMIIAGYKNVQCRGF